MDTTIIIPTYNESENIASLLQDIFSRSLAVQILVVDDNSPDGTGRLIQELQGQYSNLSLFSREKKEGLGKAYKDAFLHILQNPEIKRVVMMDADFSHNPKYLSEMLAKSQEYDLVIGSRYVNGGGVQGWNFWRRLLSLGGNKYSRIIVGIPLSDCTAGFNSISTEFLKKIDLENIHTNGYAFQVHLKYLLWKAGASIFEVPIHFTDRVFGKSKLSSNIIQEGLLLPWKIRFENSPVFTKKVIKEVVGYIGIGLLGTVIDMGVFFGANHFFSSLISQWFGALTGAFHNQLWHHYYLFDHKKSFLETLQPVFLLTIISILLSGPLLLGIHFFIPSLFICKILLIGVMGTVNFLLRKFWVFRSISTFHLN